jgi:hypothetical protein
VLPAERRQICWAHLIRTRIAFYERDGPLGWWAADMLAQVDLMFGLWTINKRCGIFSIQCIALAFILWIAESL